MKFQNPNIHVHASSVIRTGTNYETSLVGIGTTVDPRYLDFDYLE